MSNWSRFWVLYKWQDMLDYHQARQRDYSEEEAFKETAINVTFQSQRHLGAVIGSQEYVEEYVNDKVTK